MSSKTTRFTVVFFLLTISGLPHLPLDAKPSRSGKVTWLHSRREAMSAARKTGKPILVDVNTSWCGPCLQMKRDVFQKPVFAKEAARWVLLDLDGDRHAALASFYGVRGFPTLIVLSSRGKVIAKQAGYSGPSATLGFVRKAYSKAKN